MKRSTLIGILLAIGAGVLVLLMWPKQELTPEQIIYRNVLQMQRAAEEKDVGAIMEHVSDRFQGEPQALNKDDLRRFLAAQILRGAWVRVFVRDTDIRLTSATEATFEGKFVFGRSEADTLEKLAAESRVGGYRVTGKLELEQDGAWRFVSAGYEAIPPGQLF